MLESSNETRPKRSQSIDKLATALAKAQGQMLNADKDAKGTYGKYATLAATWDAIRKPLSDNEIAVYQRIMPIAGNPTLCTMLIHSSGEFMDDCELELRFDNSNRMTAMQAMGSAVTYARRYCLQAVTGVAPADDDDGVAAGSPKVEPKKVQKPAPANVKALPQPKPNFVPASFEDLNDLSAILASREIGFEVVQAAVKTAYNFTLKKDDPEIPKTIVDEVREYLYSADATGGGLEAWAKEKAAKRAQPRSIRTPVDPGDYVLEIGAAAGKRLAELDSETLTKIVSWSDGELKKTPPPQGLAVIMDTNLKVKAFLKSKATETK